jgi:hypothetical protein
MRQIVIVLFIILLILILYCQSGIDSFLPDFNIKKTICSPLDGESYDVCSEFKDPEKAADVLAHLNNMNIEFIRYVRSTRGKVSPQMKEKIDALLKRYNPQVMLENTPHNNDSPRSTSFTTNKGENMYICIRSLEDDSIENIKNLEFVVLHELAHVATEIWGHESPFWVTFKWVLQQAKQAGIHEPINYSKNPMRYCGMNVNYNPYFDSTLPNLV